MSNRTTNAITGAAATAAPMPMALFHNSSFELARRRVPAWSVSIEFMGCLFHVARCGNPERQCGERVKQELAVHRPRHDAEDPTPRDAIATWPEVGGGQPWRSSTHRTRRRTANDFARDRERRELAHEIRLRKTRESTDPRIWAIRLAFLLRCGGKLPVGP